MTVGIRLEDKNEWERRVPLVPADVAELVKDHGLRFLVQSSHQRAFSDEEYRAAGAEVIAELDPARVVFAVKEVPIAKILPERAYVFFAHVIKGQDYNMPLLARLLEERATLIDYERIVGADGRRLIFFSREAGQAGMIDALHVLGRRFAWEGSPTPLTEVRRAYEYRDLEDAKTAIAAVGKKLARGFEIDDAPLVVAFTGRGHVSQGAQEIFDLLPHVEVAPNDLEDLDENPGIVKVRFQKEHLAQPREAKAFDEDEYRNHPERFRGGRLVRYLPHVTVLMHGVYWSDDYPRFLTRREAGSMWKAGAQKLRLIGDVSCDIGGSIELTRKATTPGNPTYTYNPLQESWHDGDEGPGITVLAVDNFPCELPSDASRNFSSALRGFVPAIAEADYSRSFEELALPEEIRRAVITHRGELTPDYRYLEEFLD